MCLQEAELLRQLEDVDVDSGDDSDDGVGHGTTFAARTYNALSAAERLLFGVGAVAPRAAALGCGGAPWRL